MSKLSTAFHSITGTKLSDVLGGGSTAKPVPPVAPKINVTVIALIGVVALAAVLVLRKK